MTQPVFTWDIPPSALQEGVAKYGENLLVALVAIAQRRAMEGQDERRKNARRMDRTGNSRSGLSTKVEVVNGGEEVTVLFSPGHTVIYGIYLETSYAGKYAIIAPTVSNYGPKIMNDVRALLK